MDKMPLIVVDVDGTVSDPSHRLHLLEDAGSHSCLSGTPRERIERFMNPSLMELDKPIRYACEWVRLMIRATRWSAHVVFLTGRWESRREVTARWLNQQVHDRIAGPGHWQLVMRGEHDDRPAEVVKRDALAKLLDRGHTPRALFDDHAPTLAMARELGFVAYAAPDCFDRGALRPAMLAGSGPLPEVLL